MQYSNLQVAKLKTRLLGVLHAVATAKPKQAFSVKPIVTAKPEGFLTDRSQYVILNNMKSYATSVLSGVPQGTVLAPFRTVSNI